MIVTVGTLDDRLLFNSAAAIFTCDNQEYHYNPEGIPAFDKRPPAKTD